MGEVVERHVRLEDGFAFVATEDDTPVGLIAVYRRSLPQPLAEFQEGFINIIEVSPSHRRRGIGWQLVEMAIMRCRSAGFYQVSAWSSEDKLEAISMWKTLGFTLCPAAQYPRGQEVRGYLVAHRL